MDPPGSLQCELRPYQKQALYWMVQLEKGRSMDAEATTLHPCWEAYHLADKYAGLLPCVTFDVLLCFIYRGFYDYRRGYIVYLNAFSGDATTEFPSTLQMARGGVCLSYMI